MANKPLIFLHIPKAGGMTLHNILKRQFSPQEIYNIEGTRIQDSISNFMNLPKREKLKVKCLKGHMPYGLHKELLQAADYITLLRKPSERLISEYYYILSEPKHKAYEFYHKNSISLEEHIRRHIETNANNLQTRWISGLVNIDKFDPPYPLLSENALEIAKENIIRSFSVAGTVEMFDESLLLMKRTYCWKNIYYTRRNVTINRPKENEISKKVIKDIIKCNNLDMELYEFVQRRLEQQIREQGKEFKKELILFKRMNKIYSKMPNFIRRVYKRFLG